MSVFSGSCASPTCVDSNDEGFDCTFGQSKVPWCTEAGEVYYILVNSYSEGDEGPFEEGPFELVLKAAPVPPTPAPTPPSTPAPVPLPSPVPPAPTPLGTGTCGNFVVLVLAIILKIFTFGLVNLCA